MTTATDRIPEQTSIGAREDELIEELIEELRATVEEEVTEGGSPARILRIRMPDGTHQVLKLQVEMPGAVDGHDLESFRVKLRQIDKIRADAPALRDVYTEKLREFHGHDWSAYTMPYYPNEDIAASIRGERPDVAEFFDRFDVTMSLLARRGWSLEEVRSEPGQIAEIHADRLTRRFWLLERHLPREYTERGHLIVNGVPCRHPLEIAELLARRPELTRHVDATRLHFPAHGDLNTRNVLVTGREDGLPTVRIIDPRGTLQPWDLGYDWGKVLFSLTVWDAGLREGFEIDTAGTDFAREVSVHQRGGLYPGYREAARGLVDAISDHEDLAPLVAGDPGWRSRLLLGHGFHLLAEAACRLSDIKKRASTVGSIDLSPIELAGGHYLLGVLFLENAVAQLEENGEIDPVTHLNLLDL
ncbi:hypothetical protein KIK06_08400 [Nocardiopsis sp. EMB25]|uniref:hypothetical protein n=1 Tax=Nocardiopsis sp. EMB25 TaxID=2835867 RepID=UPI00228335A3|nr:hypothetical protein [Nocardiopsis sp. EMB25]MCY9783911.1 hypothetical protein [Nocardiopsis sp. EMB25]